VEGSWKKMERFPKGISGHGTSSTCISKEVEKNFPRVFGKFKEFPKGNGKKPFLKGSKIIRDPVHRRGGY
jgi:type IV secretory pathway ATPase VirB11/archaellum biosynthesis ATPase